MPGVPVSRRPRTLRARLTSVPLSLKAKVLRIHPQFPHHHPFPLLQTHFSSHLPCHVLALLSGTPSLSRIVIPLLIQVTLARIPSASVILRRLFRLLLLMWLVLQAPLSTFSSHWIRAPTCHASWGCPFLTPVRMCPARMILAYGRLHLHTHRARRPRALLKRTSLPSWVLLILRLT